MPAVDVPEVPIDDTEAGAMVDRVLAMRGT
jgi:hypothetical protein